MVRFDIGHSSGYMAYIEENQMQWLDSFLEGMSNYQLQFWLLHWHKLYIHFWNYKLNILFHMLHIYRH